MQSSLLIKISQVIGKGLEAQNCRLELKPISGDGMFWKHQDYPEGVGVWIPLSDWKKAVLEQTGISVLEKMPEDFAPCISAVIFEVVGSWIVEAVAEKPETFTLEETIAPVLTLGGVRCVLVNWPTQIWQPMVSHWAPFVGESPTINLSLVAGYSPQKSNKPKIPKIGEGFWIDNECEVEEGQALLWWQGPVAKIRLSSELAGGVGSMMVDDVLSEVDFHYPPLLTELAKVEMNLADIGTMMIGDELPIKVLQQGEARIVRQIDELHSQTLATVSLLRSPSGLIAKVESIEPEEE
ncbi:hypothetical protein SOPP22_19465 [Shewanella sp. OPT22]|nr:hypothetical protein SOPP22_19465 [Shewanella sp. OPT22]